MNMKDDETIYNLFTLNKNTREENINLEFELRKLNETRDFHKRNKTKKFNK